MFVFGGDVVLMPKRVYLLYGWMPRRTLLGFLEAYGCLGGAGY